MNRSRGQPGQRRFVLSFCATRAFTSFLTRAIGSGLSVGKWMVPLDVEKPLSSFLNASITDAVGNNLQWLENAANHTSDPLYLNPGIPNRTPSVASGGTADRIAARTLFKVLRAGSGTPARYSSVFFGAALRFAPEPRPRACTFFMRVNLRHIPSPGF